MYSYYTLLFECTIAGGVVFVSTAVRARPRHLSPLYSGLCDLPCG